MATAAIGLQGDTNLLRLTPGHIQSRGVASPSFRRVSKKTWAGFWKFVNKELPKESLDEIERSDFPQERNQLEMYLRNAFETAKTLPNISETSLQRACLDPLITFGNRVLEEASDGITSKATHEVNYELDAGHLRRITFTSLDDDSSRCDFALRHRCTAEDTGSSAFTVLPRYPTTYVVEKILKKRKKKNKKRNQTKANETMANTINAKEPLPVVPHWRMMPWEIIAFLELKRKNAKLEKHIGQLAYYCDNLLQITPGRQAAFGVLTNLHECRFVAACVHQGKLRWYTGPTITEPAQAIRELAHFLTTPTELLRATFRFPADLMRPQRALGSGSTGAVMSVIYADGEKLVAKVSADPYALETERIILQHLHQHDIPCIPRVAAQQAELLGNQVCVPGSTNVYCNLFDHEFQKPTADMITAERLCALWDTLAAVHAVGVVHCDL